MKKRPSVLVDRLPFALRNPIDWVTVRRSPTFARRFEAKISQAGIISVPYPTQSQKMASISDPQLSSP